MKANIMMINDKKFIKKQFLNKLPININDIDEILHYIYTNKLPDKKVDNKTISEKEEEKPLYTNEEFEKMNLKKLAFLVQDTSDYENINDLFTNNMDELVDAFYYKMIVPADYPRQNISNKLSEFMSWYTSRFRNTDVLDPDSNYAHVVTVKMTSNGLLEFRIYSAYESQGDNLELKHFNFFKFIDESDCEFYYVVDKITVKLYNVYENFNNFDKYFNSRIPEEMKKFIKIHYVGELSPNMVKLQLMLVDLYLDFNTTMFVKFDKLFTQYLPVLLKKATFDTVADEKESQLAVVILNYLKDTLLIPYDTSYETNRAMIDGLKNKYSTIE